MRTLLALTGCSLLLAACGNDIDRSRGDSADEADPTAAPVSFEDLIKSIYHISSLTRRQAPIWYLGKSGDDPCTVGSGLPDETSWGLQIGVVSDIEDLDLLAGVVVGDDDDIVRTVTPDAFVYDVDDAVCFGSSHIEAQYAGGVEHIRKLTALKTAVSETGCNEDGKLTVHERKCTDLQLTYVETNKNFKAASALMKQASVAPERIVPSRASGCELDLGHDSNLVCSWDISDDVEGDTGDIEAGIFELKDGAPSKVIGTFFIDKFTGGIED